QRALQLLVQGDRARGPSVHGREHLHRVDGIEAEAARDTLDDGLLHELTGALRITTLDDEEVALRVAGALRRLAVEDAIGVLDDAALPRLAEDDVEPHYGDPSAVDEIPQHRAGPDRGELIGVADDHQPGLQGERVE